MKYRVTALKAVLALLFAGQAYAGPTDSFVKDEVAGVRLGDSLDQALITLKREGYQAQTPPAVSCGDTQYNGITIKPCDLHEVRLTKADNEGTNDIDLEVTSGVSERLDYALQEAVIWRVSLFVTLADPNQSTRSTFDTMIAARYPHLQRIDASDMANFTNCGISDYNVNLPARGAIYVAPSDERLPLGNPAVVHCEGILASISLRPGFENIHDKPGLDIVFFDNDLRDRVNSVTYDKLLGWAKQDESHPLSPRF